MISWCVYFHIISPLGATLTCREENFSSLTCVLSELVHGLQVDDVRGELAIHLPQHHTSPGIPLQYVLNMVTNSCGVGPPAPVFVQPLPDHHPGQVLRRVPQPVDGHQQP